MPGPPRRAALVFLACALLPGCAAPPPETVRAAPTTGEPAEAIRARLDAWLPIERARRRIPGVAVALVRDGAVAWTAGYGDVAADAIFEVASNSKPVAAYTALALAAEGALDLDAPLDRLLPEPLLEPSPHRDGVTARRVLSHTAGLSNWLTGIVFDGAVSFAPGSDFAYSGHGYTLLERAIEAVTGAPYPASVERLVLAPLGMASSGYGLARERASRWARPHLPGAVPAVLVLLAWLAATPLVRLLVRAPRARPLVRIVAAVAALSALLAARGSLLDPTVVGLLAGLAACVELAVAGALRLARDASARTPARIGAVALAALALAALATRPALPAPWREPDLVAAGGLRASAGDLARFLAALVAPRPDRGLDPALVAALATPQFRLSEHLSWGLGIGIQHASDPAYPDALWHWGFNPGFYSLMVGHPRERSGVVVLTNGGERRALELAREIAVRALGGEHRGYWAEVPLSPRGG